MMLGEIGGGKGEEVDVEAMDWAMDALILTSLSMKNVVNESAREEASLGVSGGGGGEEWRSCLTVRQVSRALPRALTQQR